MNAFDPNAYGPAIASLLIPSRLAPLDAGWPNLAARDKLAALTVEELFPGQPIKDRNMADACRAGLFLYHDCLDESHAISQEIDTPTGSYWHGIMHRREPDYSNAKYWFQRVGDHPVYTELYHKAVEILDADEGVWSARTAEWLRHRGHWDPAAMVDWCRAAETDEESGYGLLEEIQMREIELLLRHSYRSAVGE